MQLKNLLEELEALLTFSEFNDHCPNGLQVEGKAEVKRVGFAVSASLATIQEAVRRNVDALIVHHGIFWEKDPYPLVGAKKNKIEQLLSSRISLIACHLPLDAHVRVGNNWKAAADLGWHELSPFLPLGKQYLGVKARFSPRPVSVLQKELETYYGHPAHVALGGKKEVSSAALVAGGAHRYLDRAADAGVDCYITGSFDEMTWNGAYERGIHFFALGHYATERVGIQALMQELQHQQGLSCEWIELFNPF